MKTKVLHTLRHILGYGLIVLGILGLILPILPGWWVILIGFEILGWKLIIHPHKPLRQMIQLTNENNKKED